MKIKIKPKNLAVLEVDMVQFKKEFKKSLSIEDAYYKNTVVLENEVGIEDRKVREVAFYSIDWNELVVLLNSRKKPKMRVFINSADVDGLMEYKPKKRIKDAEGVEYHFQTNILQENRVIVSHDWIPLDSHHLQFFIANTALDYSQEDWDGQKKVQKGK